MRWTPLKFFMLLALMFTCCGRPETRNPKVPPGAKSSGGSRAVIATDKGEIEIELFQNEAPKAVENFRLLAEHGYYDGLTFHRIVKGFMIQGGDPQGDGKGGESAWGGTFEDEINPASAIYRRGYRRGIVAMANSGPNTNGSQFFITVGPAPHLNGKHTIFGSVVEGLDVAVKISEVPVGPANRPRSDVMINRILIERRPKGR